MFQIMASITVVGLTALVPLVCSAAQNPPGEWQPAPPMPDSFDWIQLKSGEWLKGELTALYDGSLEFDSDELDELTLDWDDVQQVRTARTMQVRFQGLEPVTGRLLVDGDTIRVIGDSAEQQYDRGDLLSVASAESRGLSAWSGRATVGFNLRRGNSEQLEANTLATALRRTVQTRVTLDYIGNYNITNDVTAANNQRANAGIDWFVSDRVFVRPVLAEYFRDPFQNLAHRWTVGAAVGYQLVDTSRVSWEFGVGPAYQYTRFESVVPGEAEVERAVALAASTTYTNELTSDIDYSLQYQLLLLKPEAGRYLHHFITGLSVDAFGPFDVDFSFIWDRVDQPRRDSSGLLPKKDDYRLIFGLAFDF